MNRIIPALFLIIANIHTLTAQMWNGVDTLYGNEWIRYDRQHFKIPVADDGIYRIGYETLVAQGVPADMIAMEQYQLFHLGEEVPLYATTTGIPGQADYLEFYGRKNRSELDRHLFKDGDEAMLNPYYSLFTDTAAYFLTWAEPGEPTLRYASVLNDLTNLPPKEEWYWAEERRVFTGAVKKTYTRFGDFNVYYSHFDTEGFSTRDSNIHSFTVPIIAANFTGAGATLELRILSNDNVAGHRLRIRLENQTVAEEEFTGSRMKIFQFPLDIQQAGAEANVEVRGLNNNDLHAVGCAVLRYARAFHLNGAAFLDLEIEASATEKYLEFSGYSGVGQTVLYDHTNGIRLLPVEEDGVLKVKLPPSDVKRRLSIARPSAVRQVETLMPINFVNYGALDAEYIIISHPALFDDGQGNNWVSEYAAYRSSPAGGGYSTAIVDIRQLYDQFAYGVQRHSISVRNFAHFVKREWTQPKYVFIIGKGRPYLNMRTHNQVQNNQGNNFFVPSFGYEASDNLLLSGNETSVPVLPVGRIAATTPNEVRIYLEKIQALEANQNNPQTIEGRAWMKRVIHLGGGDGPSQQAQIRNHLTTLAHEMTTNTFGADVRAFYKISLDPIQTSISEQIFNAINQGASMLTFFGHTGSYTFDINIDNPDNYDNFGKFPLMLSLGCYSGDIFTGNRSIGERFTFLQGKGAAAFGASVGVGEVGALAYYARLYYRNLGREMYGAGIGDALRATTQELDAAAGLFLKTLVQQFILHGDPAIRLHPSPGPDYVVDASSAAIEPKVVTASGDSISVRFNIMNIGRNVEDSIAVEIKQGFPDGSLKILRRDTMPAPAFSLTSIAKLPNPGRAAVGLNTLYIKVDADNRVEELPQPEAEANNELARPSGETGVPFFVIDNSARPIYPPEFAIVAEPEVVLKASTTDALAPERTYIMEIDTTTRFDSPLLRQTEIRQTGGLLKWVPPLSLKDSVAYYWRVSPDSTDTYVGYAWANSSFTFIKKSPAGWRQGHFFQFQDNAYHQMLWEPESRKLEFFRRIIGVRIRNKIDSDPIPGLVFNNEGYAGSVKPWKFINAGVAVVVSHPKTASFWRNPPNNSFQAGDYGVETDNSRVFAFHTSTLDERANLIEFLTQIIPDGYFVFLFTIVKNTSSDFQPESWPQDSVATGNNIFSVLEAEGAFLVRQLENTGSVPYIFMYEKGAGPMAEVIGSSIHDEINAEIFIPQFFTEGTLKSTLIGPARNWESLSWSSISLETPGTDSAAVSVFGVDKFGNEAVLIERLNTPDTLLAFVQADSFPFLRLFFQTKDEANYTPVQLGNWTVLFEGHPEAAVNPQVFFQINKDTIQQGAAFSYKIGVENVTPYPMDSLLVKYVVRNQANAEDIIYRRYGPLEENGTLVLDLGLDTRTLAGPHLLSTEINPDGDQPERYHFNNFALSSFHVFGDRFNPLLEVTFDGMPIMDGDLVSSKPDIVVSLQDENPYLLLSDTSLFTISMTYPDGNSIRVPLQGEWSRFYPATESGKNKARVELTPELLMDGTYQLTVQARDASGNVSGQHAYSISFEVINRKSISNVLNYPNPFSTSTQFVYTLTGDEPPADFKIQIMTVSGRIVREITQAELGPLRVGTHRTDYAWDGTDEFGDRLANGVYLYRVVAKDFEGKEFERYDNGTSRFFKNEFGKLVILR